jgi:hypothetical protein
MALKTDRASEDSGMFEGNPEAGSTEWLLPSDSLRPKYQKTVKLQRNIFFHLVVLLPWCLLGLLSSWIWAQHQWHKVSKFDPSQQVYSRCLTSLKSPILIILGPVEDLIEYELRYFGTGHDGDPSPYFGAPSPELDKAWDDLYPSEFCFSFILC